MKYILAVLSMMLIPFTAPITAQSVEYQWHSAKGEQVSLDSYKGKSVVLHFWASWCPPCRTEMPAIETWIKAHPEVNVVMISLDSDQEDAQDFYDYKGIDVPLNMGDMRKTSVLGIRGLPTTIIVGADGEIKKRHIGDVQWENEEVSLQVLSWL